MAFSPDGRYLVAVNSNEALDLRSDAARAADRNARGNVRAAGTAALHGSPGGPVAKPACVALGHGEAALADKDTAGALLWSIKALRDDPDLAACTDVSYWTATPKPASAGRRGACRADDAGDCPETRSLAGAFSIAA